MNLLLRKGVCPGGPALSEAAPPAVRACSAAGDPSSAAYAPLHQGQNSLTSDRRLVEHAQCYFQL